MAKEAKKRMSEQDKMDWENLYNYVRYNVLSYDIGQSLSQKMVLRLKGLLYNKFMENLNIDDTANYSFRTILNTFKFCMPDIQKGLRSNSFKDEDHKFNYILKIVESNINTVYLRMKQSKEAKEKTKSANVDSIFHSGANYQTKSKETSEALDDLW